MSLQKQMIFQRIQPIHFTADDLAAMERLAAAHNMDMDYVKDNYDAWQQNLYKELQDAELQWDPQQTYYITCTSGWITYCDYKMLGKEIVEWCMNRVEQHGGLALHMVGIVPEPPMEAPGYLIM